jgi:hypothetical protein
MRKGPDLKGINFEDKRRAIWIFQDNYRITQTSHLKRPMGLLLVGDSP